MGGDKQLGSAATPPRNGATLDSGGLPKRRLPIGAELHASLADFRVWAPKRSQIDVVFGRDGTDRRLRLERDQDGYFSGRTEAQAGETYWLRLDGAEALLPDPASRFQPEGPHGPSELIDPSLFAWHNKAWVGPSLDPGIIYEMHVGTFTPAGTWRAALAHLTALRDLGITVLEIMPVAEFPGRFGWGYDGVDIFAPTHLYGRPDDFRHFVDVAHGLGMGVILDVVYNHLGPDGNYLTQFTDSFFTDRYECEWGDAINFDGEGSAGTREFILANARYWIDEFRLDGLRLDATQQIFDASPVHVLAEIADVTRDLATRQRRHIYLVCENEPQDIKLVCPRDQGGYELDALWNDDFHHSAAVAATGQKRAYLSGYQGVPQEFISAAKYGFLYQGQHYTWQGKRRGTPTLGLARHRFVNYIQNHDQVANIGAGKRLHQLTSFGRYKALTALLILLPGAPMLLQGQEFAASTPFTFFADHKTELAGLVRRGRTDFLSQFDNLAAPDMAEQLPDPGDIDNFKACILDHGERERNQHAQALALHRDLIHLRRNDPVLRSPERGVLDGAVLGESAFLLRWLDEPSRLLLVNLGPDLRLPSLAEPLLAPAPETTWRLLWSSENPAYGGLGTSEIETAEHWYLPGQSAVLLAAGRGKA